MDRALLDQGLDIAACYSEEIVVIQTRVAMASDGDCDDRVGDQDPAGSDTS
jgi:hypothetical protein